jgi:hypothetical protein
VNADATNAVITSTIKGVFTISVIVALIFGNAAARKVANLAIGTQFVNRSKHAFSAHARIGRARKLVIAIGILGATIRIVASPPQVLLNASGHHEKNNRRDSGKNTQTNRVIQIRVLVPHLNILLLFSFLFASIFQMEG